MIIWMYDEWMRYVYFGHGLGHIRAEERTWAARRKLGSHIFRFLFLQISILFSCCSGANYC